MVYALFVSEVSIRCSERMKMHWKNYRIIQNTLFVLRQSRLML